MKNVLLLLILLASLTASGQGYISVKKFFVKKGSLHYLKTQKFSANSLSETDSTLIVKIDEPRMANLSFIYLFDANNKCVEEKLVAVNCDSCFNKLNAEVLANKKWGWQKLSENLYASKYSKHLLLRINKNGSTSQRSIYHTSWNRKEYEALVNNKN